MKNLNGEVPLATAILNAAHEADEAERDERPGTGQVTEERPTVIQPPTGTMTRG